MVKRFAMLMGGQFSVVESPLPKHLLPERLPLLRMESR